MTAQQNNVAQQEAARARMDQANDRRVDAMGANDAAAWDRAQMVWEAAARDWQALVKEGAETAW